MSSEEALQGVEYPHPFDELAVAMCQDASRYIAILSPQLDRAVFDSQALAEALSELARRSRQTEVRILVADSRDIVTRNHRLLQLARRIPSCIHVRRLREHPDWNGETLVVRDRNGVLFVPAGAEHQGFYEPQSRASAESHLELFEDLWRYSEEDPELRTLSV